MRIKQKELVLLLGKNDLLVEVDDRRLKTQYGIIDLSVLKGKLFGEKIKSHTGEEFTIVRPSIVDILSKKAKRLPQIVTPKDAALILAYTGIPTDSLVVDSGSGSGFLAIFLAHYCNKGKVVTYERNPNFAKIVKKNIELSRLKNIVLKEKDILKGLDEKNIDLVTLDMQFAEMVVKNVYHALKSGGWLVVYSPHIEQVKSVSEKVKEFNFSEPFVLENVVREWQVNYGYTRPKTLGLMHTGWITIARKK